MTKLCTMPITNQSLIEERAGKIIMGVISTIACKTCKAKRGLDKYYICHNGVNNRADAIKYEESLLGSKMGYRTAPLLSFLEDHKSHDVVYFNEYDDDLEEETDLFDYDGFFWE